MDKLRMAHWAVFSGLIYLAAMYVAQPQLQIVLWKIGHITVAAFVGYWIDRNVFRDSRIHSNSLPMLQVRRAIIIGAAMLAISMGM